MFVIVSNAAYGDQCILNEGGDLVVAVVIVGFRHVSTADVLVSLQVIKVVRHRASSPRSTATL